LVRLLARIVRAGLAIAKPDSVKAGGRTLALGRIVITEPGGARLPACSGPRAHEGEVYDGPRQPQPPSGCPTGHSTVKLAFCSSTARCW
jgi:hypothetical protein